MLVLVDHFLVLNYLIIWGLMKGNTAFAVLKPFKLGMSCEDEYSYFCHRRGHSFWYSSMLWWDTFFTSEIVSSLTCRGYSVFVVMVAEIISTNQLLDSTLFLTRLGGTRVFLLLRTCSRLWSWKYITDSWSLSRTRIEFRTNARWGVKVLNDVGSW